MNIDELAEACREWSPRALALFYNWVLDGTGMSLPAHMYPVICALCDVRIRKLQMQAGPGSTKSQAISIIYPAFELGHHPQKTIMGISGAEHLSQGFLQAAMGIVASNPAFSTAFPNVLPDKSQGWSPASGMYVTGHPPGISDASFWACGLASKALTGKHANIIILDDLHDADNSSSAEACADVVYKYNSQIVGRAAVGTQGASARFILAGRRWNVDDLYGRLEYNGDWVTMRLPFERAGTHELYYDVFVPETADGQVLECVFTDGMCMADDGSFTLEREEVPEYTYLERKEAKAGDPKIRHYKWLYGYDERGKGFFWPGSSKEAEYFNVKQMSPSVAESVYQCNPGARQGSVFVDEDFRRVFTPPPDLDLGKNCDWLKKKIDRGGVVIQSWDTAFSANSTSDYTVGITMLLMPCGHWHNDEDPDVVGECDPHYDIWILDVYRKRENYNGVVTAIREQFLKWAPATVVVEKKAYAVAAIENLESVGVPLEPVTPGPLESKRARAVEGVSGGSAQGWFRMHRVLMPTEADWDIDAFIREMKDFTGEKGGRDDQVDATVHGVRWAIGNGGSTSSLPEGWRSVAEVDASMRGQGLLGVFGDGAINNPLGDMLNADVYDPFHETCGRCRFYVQNIRDRKLTTAAENIATLPGQWCTKHNQAVHALLTCDDQEHVDQPAMVLHRF